MFGLALSASCVHGAFAARAPDRVVREISLSESCSRTVQEALKISNNQAKAGVRIPIEAYGQNASSSERENLLQLTEGGDHMLKIGSHWRDRAGAVPRLKGLRFEFLSDRVLDMGMLAPFWQNAREVAMRGFRAEKRDGYMIIGEASLCGGAENVQIIVLEIPGYKNEYGKQLRMFQVLFQFGEILPEIRANPLLD